MVAESPDAPSRAELIALIHAQAAQITALVARVAELERRLGLNSTNVEADFETHPEERRRFAIINVPRHLFSEATGRTARRAAKDR